MDPSAVIPDDRLCYADVGEKRVDKSDGDHIRDMFYRMGFNDQEIVVLSGVNVTYASARQVQPLSPLKLAFYTECCSTNPAVSMSGAFGNVPCWSCSRGISS